ncbi:MAG: hypothetical protein SP1CHLAM9_11230 [Chlamydiia bacterium]|nr:hypothetical protein [Chlamydiia bacterium]
MEPYLEDRPTRMQQVNQTVRSGVSWTVDSGKGAAYKVANFATEVFGRASAAATYYKSTADEKALIVQKQKLLAVIYKDCYAAALKAFPKSRLSEKSLTSTKMAFFKELLELKWDSSRLRTVSIGETHSEEAYEAFMAARLLAVDAEEELVKLDSSYKRFIPVIEHMV